jgi:hypothetical protein
MKSNRPRSYKFRNKKEKIQMDWSHTKRNGKYQRPPYMESSSKQEERKT